MDRDLGGGRTWGVGLALVCLWVAGCWAFARTGFNPTDEGLFLSQASRLLHGASPHGSLISPRPLGTPLLHTVDVVLPTPLLVTSRVIALAEVLVTVTVVLVLVLRRGLRTWSVPEVALVSVAFVLNLHTFPLLSWHTVDGLLVVALALWTLARGLRSPSLALVVGGALLAGFAPLIKQSFAPAPLVAIAWVVWVMRTDDDDAARLRPRTVALAMASLVVPGSLYLLWVALTSSLGAMADQLLVGTGVEWLDGVAISPPIGGVIVAAIVVALIWRRQQPGAEGSDERSRLARMTVAGAAVALALVSVGVVLAGGLELAGGWGIDLWWLAAVGAGLWSIVDESIDAPSMAVLAMAWMASLSWGYAVPNLMAGSLLCVVLVCSWRVVLAAAPLDLDAPRLARVPLLTVVLAALFLPMSVNARRSEVYRDRSAGQLTADLADFSSDAAGIETNPVTAAYLDAIRSCLTLYPADRLAVLPDNAVVPLLLGRTNPMPLDWWYPLEIPADRGPVRDDVRAVSGEGDYLVLFQTTTAEHLAGLDALPEAGVDASLFDYHGGMAEEVYDLLGGTAVACGPFVGKWSPATG